MRILIMLAHSTTSWKKNDTGIQVDTIYTIAINEERYLETAQSYDNVDSYLKFKEIISTMDNVRYLNAGDELNLIGLDMKVLSVWDETVDQLEVNLINDGSMMFKVSGADESMLFCADVQKEMQDEILTSFADDLDVDYVQLGHHGNWGLTSDFYALMSPKAVFFDAPSTIIDDEENIYDAFELKHYFENQGVTIYRFSTAPNSIQLH